jgi:hypothetical protein
MTVPVLNRAPDEITAGEDISWYAAPGGEYTPANGYALKLAMNKTDGTDTVAAISGVPTGDNLRWTLAIVSATSGGMAAGQWAYQIRAEHGTNGKQVVEIGRFEILPDFQLGAVDARSHAQQVLDALNARIEGKATRDQLAYTVAGRTIQRLTPEQLRGWRAEYERRVRAEANRERRRRGLGTGDKIFTRW